MERASLDGPLLLRPDGFRIARPMYNYRPGYSLLWPVAFEQPEEEIICKEGDDECEEERAKQAERLAKQEADQAAGVVPGTGGGSPGFTGVVEAAEEGGEDGEEDPGELREYDIGVMKVVLDTTEMTEKVREIEKAFKTNSRVYLCNKKGYVVAGSMLAHQIRVVPETGEIGLRQLWDLGKEEGEEDGFEWAEMEGLESAIAGSSRREFTSYTWRVVVQPFRQGSEQAIGDLRVVLVLPTDTFADFWMLLFGWPSYAVAALPILALLSLMLLKCRMGLGLVREKLASIQDETIDEVVDRNVRRHTAYQKGRKGSIAQELAVKARRASFQAANKLRASLLPMKREPGGNVGMVY